MHEAVSTRNRPLWNNRRFVVKAGLVMSEPYQFASLREALQEWEDPDVTAYYLARCLGLIAPDVSFAASKPTVFTANPVSDLLYKTLEHLVRIGALEQAEDGPRYRWNQSFRTEVISQ